MEKERLTAFSDGVIAIIIIMVLGSESAARVRLGAVGGSGAGLSELRSGSPLRGDLLEQPSPPAAHLGLILWANTHLLFWLSLIPFATAYLGENHFSQLPTARYGVSLLMPAIAYYLLQLAILRKMGPRSTLARALGRDLKGKISIVFYGVAIPLAFVGPP